MKTIVEVQAAIDALPPLMTEKGIVNPEAHVTMQASASHYVMLKGEGIGNYDIKSFNGDTIEESIRAARDWIAVLPSPKTKAIIDYLGKLSEAVEIGRDGGIPDEYITPVASVFRAVSDNLLPAPMAAE